MSTLEMINRHPEGDALLESLDGPDREFFHDEVFLAGTRYPIEPFFRLTKRLAAVAKKSVRAYMTQQSLRMAGSDADGIYKASLSGKNAAALATRLPRFFNRYFSPAQADNESVVEGRARYVLSRMSREFEDFYYGANDGFIVGVMSRVSTHPKVEYDPPNGRPSDFSVGFTVTWAQSDSS